MFDKNTLIDMAIAALERDKASAASGLASARQGAKEAPSAMESHSDTTRSQMQRLAENLERDIKEKDEGIKALADFKTLALRRPEFSLAKNKAAEIGSIVTVVDENNNLFVYFILPAGGGIKIKEADTGITVLSSTAPLAKTFIGKRTGETAVFTAGSSVRRLTVISVD